MAGLQGLHAAIMHRTYRRYDGQPAQADPQYIVGGEKAGQLGNNHCGSGAQDHGMEDGAATVAGLGVAQGANT